MAHRSELVSNFVNCNGGVSYLTMALWTDERHLWIRKKASNEKRSGWLTSRGERRGINGVITFFSLLTSPRLSFVPTLYSRWLQPNDAINIIRGVKTFQFMVTLTASFYITSCLFFLIHATGKTCYLLDKLFFVLNDVLKVPHQSNVYSRNSAKCANEGNSTNWHFHVIKV